ncbi:MAG: purine-binding chemotaxis protein CheW [Candidatus Hydrogenedentes bacterium]|nr:purine-binding chemotaxis protein CheW [Candidatus Hydrogenedentota bacterium]
MADSASLVVFSLEEQRFALDYRRVIQVLRAVAHTPLPGAPGNVAGVINMRGEVVPLFSLRRRLGLPERAQRVSDNLVVARTARRTLALMVDEVIGVSHLDSNLIVSGDRIFAGLDLVEGVVKCVDGLVVIQNLDRFLSLEEDAALDTALDAQAHDNIRF